MFVSAVSPTVIKEFANALMVGSTLRRPVVVEAAPRAGTSGGEGGRIRTVDQSTAMEHEPTHVDGERNGSHEHQEHDGHDDGDGPLFTTAHHTSHLKFALSVGLRKMGRKGIVTRMPPPGRWLVS